MHGMKRPLEDRARNSTPAVTPVLPTGPCTLCCIFQKGALLRGRDIRAVTPPLLIIRSETSTLRRASFGVSLLVRVGFVRVGFTRQESGSSVNSSVLGPPGEVWRVLWRTGHEAAHLRGRDIRAVTPPFVEPRSVSHFLSGMGR